MSNNVRSRTLRWILSVEKEMEYLKDTNPKDRLDYARLISRCNKAIMGVAKGYEYWLSKPDIVHMFDEERLHEILALLKDTSIKLLESSIKWSKYIEEEFKTDEKDTYIS